MLDTCANSCITFLQEEREKYLQEKEELVAKNAALEKDVRVANKELSITKEVSTKKIVCEHHKYPIVIRYNVNASYTERMG